MAIQDFLDKLKNVSVQDYLPSQDSIAKLRNIKVQDYVPNVFGVSDPSVEGLLGPAQSKSLQSRSNIAGLLGAAAALSQGMSRGGPRRSALQNILGAAAGGYGAAGQQYQQGLQTVGQQQQLAQQMRDRERADMTRQSIDRVKQIPEVANNPALLAQLNADPINTLKFINENMALKRAMPPIPEATPDLAEPKIDPTTGLALPIVKVNASSRLFDEMNRLIEYRTNLARDPNVPTKLKQDEIKSVNEQINEIRKNLAAEGAMDFPFDTIRKDIPPQSQAAFDSLRLSVEQGVVDSKDFPKMLQDLYKKPGDVESYLYAKNEGYTGNFEQWKKGPGRVAAGETIVNVGAKKFSEEFGKGVAGAVDTTFQNALAAQNTISTIQTIKPLIQEGVYSGPLSTSRVFIDRLASNLGFASGTTEEKLARTAQSMQGLANLQLEGAKAMAGQGAITDFERGLIERASAGDFAKFTSKEVVSLMDALEKVANKKIATHKTNLTRLRKRPDTAELADFYELDAAPDSQSVRQYNPATGRIE